MKKIISLLLGLTLCVLIPLSVPAFADSAVPDELPSDLGGKTLYGYLMELKNQFMPKSVFQDAVKYTDGDRENAERAAQLIRSATTAKMEETGQPDPYMLYLRAYACELLYQAGGDAAMQAAGLADYQQTVELGGTYAQADYDRLAAMEVAAAPLSWQMPQMLTLAEMAEIFGLEQSDLSYLASGYQTADGSRTGSGYAMLPAPDPVAAAIYVLAEPQGGRERYELLKGFAFLHRAEEVTGVGDEAVCVGLRNWDNDPALYTTVLVLKDQLVLQVRVPYAAWQGADTAAIAKSVALKVLQNLYDAQRTVPAMDGIAVEAAPARLELDAGSTDSPVPDAMPSDLGGKTEYGYLVEIRQQYLPASVYGNADLPQADLNNARRAARLLVNVISQRFDRYGQNPYELEIRASCYDFAWQDTGNEAFRKLAINDYKQALSTGYALAKTAYDQITAPLLSPMAEIMEGASGENVALLQQWLIQAGYLQGEATAAFDDATLRAVTQYEEENGLTPDGVADIAFLLSLYACVDDGDAPLPGA